MTTKEIIEKAKEQATEKAKQLDITKYPESNGSEAWQATQIQVDGRSKVGRELIKLGIKKDYYWGYVVSPISLDIRLDNYYQDEAWTTEFSKVLNENGIKASRVERLL